MKKFITPAIVFLLCIIFTGCTVVRKNVVYNVTFSGRQVTFTTALYKDGEKIMAPVAELIRGFGGSVSADNENTCICVLGGSFVSVEKDRSTFTISHIVGGQYTETPNVGLAVTRNGKVWASVEHIAKGLGYTVSYNALTNCMAVTK